MQKCVQGCLYVAAPRSHESAYYQQAIAKIFENFLNFFRSFRGNSSKKFDFGHRSSALARPGSREVRGVKIPASYDPWRPPTRQKNDLEKNRFFGVSEISFSPFSWILKGIGIFQRQNHFPREILLQMHLF